jgi:hypothetical protein
MERPRREEFLLDMHRSARTLQRPNVEADSHGLETDAISRILDRAALWLTPKAVKHYHPEDFTPWPKDQQDRLHLAVESFLKIASHIAPNAPTTIDQYKEGIERLRDLIHVLGAMVLEEWMSAIANLEKQAEVWAAKDGWRSRRVKRKMSESLIGKYEATQLLIFAEPDLYVLDPIARFVPGGQGSFDVAIQPSYYSTSLYREDDGIWYVILDIQDGVSSGNREEWSRDAFRQCIEQLRALV